MMKKRTFGIGLLVALVLAACGGEPRVADTAASGAGSATTSTGADSASSAPSATAAAQGAPRAATGKTWDVKMIGDGTGYRFEPTTLAIRSGDAVRWTVVSGPPHNVTFWSDSIPPAASQQLRANMPETTAPLTGPLRVSPNATYLVSFAGLPAGAYAYYCTPHLALGMKAKITVQ